MKYGQAVCEMCKVVFEKTGPNTKRCPSCRIIWKRQYHKEYYKKHYKRKGYNGWGENNNNWKHGLGQLLGWRGKQIKKARRYCEKCGADLLEADRYKWCIHHIDEDRTNNCDENLMLVCKSCHAKIHNFHKHFTKTVEGATTIPGGSRVQGDSKRPAPYRSQGTGDDIVWPHGKP